MRIPALVTVVTALTFGACTHAPRATTTPKAELGNVPSRDLDGAKPTAPPIPGDSHLVVKDPRITDLDIIKVHVAPKGPGSDEVETTTVATADLFREAGEAVKDRRTEAAIALYRRIVSEFPESLYAPIALFDIAAILDGRGDYPGTVATLRELVAKYPDARESVEGHLYIAALQAEHQQYAEASTTLTAALARTNLSYADRVEAFARKGYVELEQKHLDAAEAALTSSVAEWTRAPRIEDPYYIAMAGYYLGEVSHARFTAVAVRLPDDQLLKDVEQKRVFAAQAYDRWRAALKHQQAYWATASGYQMSQIFVELWEATVKAPYPAHVTIAARPAYVTEVHERSREHLEKALEGHRMNVELAKAYGVETSWSKGSEVQAVRILNEIAKDSAGTYTTPE